MSDNVPSVLWRYWLGGRKGIRPVKKIEWWSAGMVICLERGADLHISQLMPRPLTVSCLSKIQIGFTFLVPAHPVSLGKGPFKSVCVLVVTVWYLGDVNSRWHATAGNSGHVSNGRGKCQEMQKLFFNVAQVSISTAAWDPEHHQEADSESCGALNCGSFWYSVSCAVDIAVDSFYQNCFLFVAALVVLHCESGFTNTVQRFCWGLTR